MLGFWRYKNRKHICVYALCVALALGAVFSLAAGNSIAPNINIANASTTQEHYQWYQDGTSWMPTSSIAFEDTSASAVTSTNIRLSISVSASSTSLSAGTKLKLQYQASTTSGAWTDVGNNASATIWRTFDNTNASATEGAVIPYMLLPESNISESYEEANPSTGTPNALTVTSTVTGKDWTKATAGAAWPKRYQTTSLVYNNKMWVMGGASTSLSTYMNDVWSSSDGITWTQATSGAAWAKRYGLTSLAYANKKWVMGGIGSGPSYLNDVWSSTNGITWTQATSGAAWAGRYAHTSFVFNNKMWVMGGYKGTYLNDVWSSTDGITWTQATSGAAWPIRRAFTSLVYNNKMWVMGGATNLGNCNGSNFCNDVWSSTDGITWTQATSGAAWAGRYAHTSLVFNNKMWVMGGTVSGGDVSDVWSSTDGITWTQATSGAAWAGRDSFGVASFATKMWVMGGFDGINYYNDVWSSAGNGNGEWNWTLQNNGATAGTSYYFRLIQSSGTVLDTYNNYPLLSTSGTAPVTLLTQDHYQWYQNANQLSPTSTLALEDASATNVAANTVLRLRMNVSVSSTALSAGTQFRLQYQQNATSGAWNDVGNLASSTPWITYDNNSASTTEGATIPYSLIPESNQVESYEEANPSTGTPNALTVTSTVTGKDWSQATSGAAWAARRQMSKVVYNGKMWIMGGCSGVTCSTYLNDVWSSTDGITWTQATSGAAWSGRSGLASLVYANKMWVMGGASSSAGINDVWSSSDGITWTLATSGAAWSGRFGHAALVYSNKMWVMGGRAASAMNDVWSSSDGVTWTQATSGAPWSGRDTFPALVYNNKMWVMGDLNSADVWSSTDGITWTQATSSVPWGNNTGIGSLVYANKMWVMGGYDGANVSRSVWYSSDGITWTQATSGAAWSGRYEFATFVFQNKMWVAGGNATLTTKYNDVWSSAGNSEGEFDWTLQQNGASSSATYYFRMADSGGNALSAYNNYPMLVTSSTSGGGASSTTLTQEHYQWYRNGDVITPTSTLAALDAAPTSSVASGTVIRLRMNVGVTGAALATSAQAFTLQFATGTSGGWANVGATSSAIAWRMYDNPSVSNGATLPATLLASSTALETYQDTTSTSVANPTQINVGGWGEWDWTIQNNGISSTRTYYFQMVKADGSVLTAYTRYPSVVSLGPYAASGTLVSLIIDTTLTNGVAPNSIFWIGTQPAGTNVQFQFASATSTAGPWIYTAWNSSTGACDTTSYYTPTGSGIPVRTKALCYGSKRYIRYKIILSTNDTTVTPQVHKVVLNYAK